MPRIKENVKKVKDDRGRDGGQLAIARALYRVASLISIG
jgi:hypothetical protein